MIEGRPTEAADLFVKYATGAKPFIKWAGGKGQLLNQFQRHYPSALKTGQITTYVEPFMGGAAVFFDVAQKFRHLERAYLFDINPELVLTYNVVKRDVGDLIRQLLRFEQDFLKLAKEDRKILFYEVRDAYNQARATIDFDDYNARWVRRAAQMIFLNKTCFNGLFRLNSKGGFNTPCGDYSNPTICDSLALKRASETLELATVERSSFETLAEKPINFSKSFIYFDPPYRPLSRTASFTAYSAESFRDDDQRRLKEVAEVLAARGAYVMLSNSDPKVSDLTDTFFDDLYEGFVIERVVANRMINSKAESRGPITEVLIKNYQN